MTIAKVLSIVNDHQFLNEAAQLRPARVSIEASPEDRSVSFLAAMFFIIDLVLASAKAQAKAISADLAVFLLKFFPQHW
jgi:hypothetical protein